MYLELALCWANYSTELKFRRYGNVGCEVWWINKGKQFLFVIFEGIFHSFFVILLFFLHDLESCTCLLPPASALIVRILCMPPHPSFHHPFKTLILFLTADEWSNYNINHFLNVLMTGRIFFMNCFTKQVAGMNSIVVSLC